jgi:hypothetical protein
MSYYGLSYFVLSGRFVNYKRILCNMNLLEKCVWHHLIQKPEERISETELHTTEVAKQDVGT